MSTRPGEMTLPGTWMISAERFGRTSAGASSPRPALAPSTIQRSWTRSMPRAGSKILPPRMQRGLAMGLLGLRRMRFGDRLVGRLVPGEQVEHGHADRDAVRDLFQDHRVLAVGDVLRDLHAAVHRAGVHDRDVGLRAPEAP